MGPGSFHVKCDAGLRVPRLFAVAAVFGQPLTGDVAEALRADHAPPGIRVTNKSGKDCKRAGGECKTDSLAAGLLY
jgi:hypothetical protein